MTVHDATNHPAVPAFGLLWGLANMAVAEAVAAPLWLGVLSALGPVLIGVGATLNGLASLLRARRDPGPPSHRCKPWSPPYDG